MAGISVGGGGGGRRALDAEINAVPMIDLMMVTIAFLLITAVWSQMSRLDASAQVPGPPTDERTNVEPRKVLDVEVKAEKATLTWKRGAEIVGPTVDVPVRESGDRYAALAGAAKAAWEEHGEHRDPSDRVLDRAVLRVPDRMEYGGVVAVMDSLQGVRRKVASEGRAVDAPAFELVMGQ